MSRFPAHEPHQAAALPPEVEQWRRRVLLRAGFDEPAARSLAGHGSVDVHVALALVDRGCPPPVAARILAPL